MIKKEKKEPAAAVAPSRAKLDSDSIKTNLTTLQYEIIQAIGRGDYSYLVDVGGLENLNQDFTITEEKIPPLHIACASGNYGMVQMLLFNQSCKVNKVDIHGNNALHVAAEHGFLDIIKLLRERGCYFENSLDGTTGLHMAARRGHVEVARYILEESNVKLDARKTNGFQALHLAALKGHLDMVQFLEAQGADLADRAPPTDVSPLYLAAKSG